MTKIAIVGVGGRTGTMFAFEFRNSADILGVGKKAEVQKLREGKIYLQREKNETIRLRGKVIEEEEWFSGNICPDFIFLCVKNPVAPAVNFYYQRIKKEGKIPSLILSQNGISVVEEAKRELEKIFGEKAKEIRIIRVSLFNPISSEKIDDEVKISYFLPIRLAFGKASGDGEVKDLKEIFKRADIKTEELSPENVKNMEFSKLFTNLIGMASAAKGLSIENGFQDKETFKEEVIAIKEYIKVVKKSGGKFLNLKHYPIKFLTSLINFLPLSFLTVFRKILAKTITKGRGGKEKGNIDEVNYYNGAVIKLGEKVQVETPVNQKIYQKIKEKL
jgi:2-dehydropantoate 2-reductase